MYRHVLVNLIVIVLLTRHNGASSAAQTQQQLFNSLPELRDLRMALEPNEDAYLNFTQLTSKYGYPSEEHIITTEDGYILTAFRILPKCNGASKRYPILLVHGNLDTSDHWIVSGEDYGLGYVLARNCYDVWTSNHRGNRYSRRHLTLNPDKDASFWDFSFDEHGNYDIPASIDYILRVTKKTKLFYAGHSQGTTEFFIMMSLKPEYNQKVQLSIHLAPLAWMANTFSPLFRVLANVRDLRKFLDAVGLRELLGRNQLPHLLLEIICQFLTEAICGNALTLVTGHEQGSISPQVLTVAFGHLLSGTSSKNIAHYGQLIESQKFKRYDEGYEGNMKRYGAPNPPEYNVSLITSPVVLITAQNDWIISLKDVKTLSSKLPNLVENYLLPVKSWSHYSHLWDGRVKQYTFPKLLGYIEKYST
jgi:lysosomal acid lipase/cholesteryl ester hydrolase